MLLLLLDTYFLLNPFPLLSLTTSTTPSFLLSLTHRGPTLSLSLSLCISMCKDFLVNFAHMQPTALCAQQFFFSTSTTTLKSPLYIASRRSSTQQQQQKQLSRPGLPVLYPWKHPTYWNTQPAVPLIPTFPMQVLYFINSLQYISAPTFNIGTQHRERS